MADSSLNPADQASLERLLSTLRAKEGEFEAVIAQARESVTAFGAMSKETLAAQQAQARELSAAKPVQTGTGSVRETVSAVKQLASAEAEVNKLLTQQIELRIQAAAAAKKQVTATEAQLGAGGAGAAGSVPRVVNTLPAESGTPAAKVLGSPAAVAAGGPAATATKQSAAAKKLAADTELLAQSQIGGARADLAYQASMQKGILITHQSANELQRHGALTTEFIAAAARGQTTIREFGSQMLQTIGKFGGWTAAAGAVYGAIGAVTSLGRGAVDAAAGVQALARFLPDLDRAAARVEISGIGSQLNVPTADVTEAATSFARIFKNQSDVFTASRVAITATKLDNIQLADSYRYLTSLTQEYGLTASELPGLFDQIEAAQAKGGARVAELFPALARSAAAVKNAGGDLSQLLALEATAIVRTGQTGNVVGTAFSRGAANFWRSPSSQKTLSDAGISATPAVGFTQAMINAIGKVSAGGFTGEQMQAISKAFFGPLRGGLLAGLMRSAPQLAHFESVTAPGASKGQAAGEIKTVLGQADEQLKQLGNNLQAIGASLAGSGLLTPLALVVKTLNLGLRTTREMLQVWNELPGPMKTAAGLLAGFAASRAIAGKLGIPAPLIGPSAEKTAGQQVSAGLIAQKQYFQEAQTAAARSFTTTTGTARAATRSADRLAVLHNASPQDDELTTKAAAARRAELAAIENVQAAENALAGAVEDNLLAAKQEKIYRAGINRGLSVQEAAANAGVQYVLNTKARGTATVRPVVPLPGTLAADTEAAAAAAAAGGVTAATTAAGGKAAAASAAVATETEGLARYNAEKVVLTERLTAESAALGATAAGIGGTGAALGGLGSALGRMIGPLFALGFVASSLIDSFKQVDDATKQADKLLGKIPKNLEAAQADARDLATQAQTVYDHTLGIGAFGEFETGLPLIGGTIASLAKAAQGLRGGDASNQTAQGLAAAEYDRLVGPVRKVKVYQGFSSGGEPYYGTGETGGVFSLEAAQASRDAKAHMGTQTDRLAWEKHRKDLTAWARKVADTEEVGKGPKTVDAIENSFAAFKGTLSEIEDAFQRGLKLLDTDPATLLSSLAGMAPKTIVANMQALTDRLKVYGANQKDLTTLATTYDYLTNRFKNSHDDTSLQLVMSAQGMFIDAVRTNVQNLIDEANAATNKQTKIALFEQARALLADKAAALKTAYGLLAAEVKFAGVTLKETEAELQAASDAAGSDTIGALSSKPAFAGGKAKASDYTFSGIAKSLAGQAQAKLKALGASNDQIDAALAPLLAAINSGEKTTKKKKAAPKSEDPYNIARLQSEIAQAQAEGDPVKQAQAAEKFAAIERAGAKGQNEKLQAQLDMIQAENQYYQAVEDRAQAQFDLLASQTTDPVKIARFQLQKATQAVKYAASHGGTDTTGYKQALAGRNAAQQNLVDTILTGKEDDVQFHLTMGDISVQTAISEYEALLHMHNLTKAKRQQILEQIKAWKNQGQSDFSALDLGSIRLPTPYEIRRGLLGAQGGMTVRQNNTVHVNVTDPGSVSQVGVVLDRYISGTGKALARASGTR